MKYIIICLKHLLLLITIVTYMVFACGIDDIVENGYPLVWVFVMAFEFILCKGFIREKDLQWLQGKSKNVDI